MDSSLADEQTTDGSHASDERAPATGTEPLADQSAAADPSRATMRRVPTYRGAPPDKDLPERLTSRLDNAAASLDIGQILATGGMGAVRQARQHSLGRNVAVKLLHGEQRSSADRLSLMREAWTTGLLEHPNIVPIHTLGIDAHGNPVIVMKRIEGVSWHQVLEDPAVGPDGMDADDPLGWHLDVLAQVSNALRYAHSRGIVHLDIKPENVMIGSFGEVYVVDWGIAASVRGDQAGRLVSVDERNRPLGSPAYMAPEMVDADGAELGEATDVYLLGATLHHVLTGAAPHLSDSVVESIAVARRARPPSFDTGTPPELAQICRRAMHADPAQRFGDVVAFRQAIVDFGRHRDSIKLTRQARGQLAKLEEALSATDAEKTEADALFGQCRFGFEQALRVWEGNDQARRGLHKTLVIMAGDQLDRGLVGAADLLIDELAEVPADLQARRDRIAAELDNRDRHFEKLEELRHESDVEVGRHTRSLFALGLGILWGTMTLIRALTAEPAAATSHGSYLMEVGIVLGVMASLLILGGRSLLQNAANRKMILSMPLIVVAGLGLRVVGTFDGVPVATLAHLETFIYGIGGAVLAIALDLRILWAVVPYLIGSFIGHEFADSAYFIYAATNFGAMTMLALAWWPSQDS